ncbi:hypothetical protein TST_0426 [Thermosulfidibacter takaii ABI70S6]|uniref:DNA polymerase III subunit delta n=1 Tax=Thermosulfidibacter takaii (strain DSM 17441 / JCM 13301 / NBRC 103674 / ABI70S6) TaxID=1298851 RepID=A0A0S3QSB6_THET7|nr:DNA polymerase III subunit delta' [Thermosulfidibacter takaii]BAT71234.1 hypothetical protein TST_0426 [Thermosulfidibacter takaii ABI70S6]
MSVVVGHKSTIEKLKSILTKDRHPQALLFVGREGIGKKRVGVLSAALFLCEKGGCLECRTCKRVIKSIKEGASLHPDFRLEKVDKGKKSITIDQIRAIKEWAYTAPMEASRKIALIDDAHLMNVHAANAFLKTLEEPPENTLFILVTSEPSMLLPTIVSRCQVIRFSPLNKDEVEEICAREGVKEEVKELCVDIGSLMFLRVKPEELKVARELAQRFLTSPSLELMAQEKVWKDQSFFMLVLMLLRKELNRRLKSNPEKKLWDFHRRLAEVERLALSSTVNLRSLWDYLLLRVA